MTKIPVSVVIITRNEETNMPDCLGSIKDWAEEIVVVDDDSTDKTREIAESLGARVFQRKMDNEGAHRNWAYAKATQEWVLSLDADERVTPELRQEISALLAAGTEHAAFNIPRRNFIGDYWLRYGGQYPSAQLRLFKRGSFRYEETYVHPRAFLEGTSGGTLKGDVLHYSYRDFAHFLTKLNGQTTLEARKWVDDQRKIGLGKALWKATDRFFRTYLRKQGYKDGFIGFMVAIFAWLYQIMSYAKYYEITKGIKQKEMLKG